MQGDGKNERELTLRVIREVADEVSGRASRDPSFARSLHHEGVTSRRRDILEEACRRVGISPEAYAKTIAADPGLVQLEDSAFKEASLGPQDPGPYDALSARDPIGSSDAAPGTPSHEPAPIEAAERRVPYPNRKKAS